MISKFMTGVYFPWETINPANLLEDRVKDLASKNVNTIWTTNGPSDLATIKRLVTYARSYGINVILGSGYWYVGDWNYTEADIVSKKFQVLQNLWDSLSRLEKPLAFSISDEPFSSVDQVAELAVLCQSYNIPTCFVGIPSTYAATKEKIKTGFSGVDSYPFFANGLETNPPVGDKALESHLRYLALARGNVNFPQMFQTWDGPARQENDGTVTLLPGCLHIWRQPTREQARWQIWASVAYGNMGTICFAYGAYGEFIPNPLAQPNKRPNVTQEYMTNSPATLVSMPKYQHGIQSFEMERCYTRIKNWRIEKVEYVRDVRVNNGQPGDIASIVKLNGLEHLIVVTSPNRPKRSWLSVNLGRQIRSTYTGCPSAFAFFGTAWIPSIESGEIGIYRI
jgi:hypothetical protein